MKREFTDSPAVLGQVPLRVGIAGYSASGKTYSALRVATGIQRVYGGDIFGIDTESKRMLQYADRFKFRHVPFAPPFNPAAYHAAIDHCVAKGSRIIIVDNMSHEHDGDGGYLQMSEDYLDEKAGDDWKRRKQLNQLSWQKPALERKRLNQRIEQLADVAFIFLYRAKAKQKLVKGEEPLSLGEQPITTSSLPYDMTLRVLLRPGADGLPTLKGETAAENMLIKSIETFRGWSELEHQLNEDLGEKLARWAYGSCAPAKAPVYHKTYPGLGGKPFHTVEAVSGYIEWLIAKREEYVAKQQSKAAGAADIMITEAQQWIDAEVDRQMAQAQGAA